MIAYLKGILEESRPGKIVIDVNGFGMNVILPESYREELPSIGNEIKVFTYMSVREDGMSLYGFLSRDALDLFNMLIGVSGLGPKGAQSLLGAFSVPDIKYFIISEDSAHLSKAPAIGKKTAERIILELKDKISKEDAVFLSQASSEFEESVMTSEVSDAIEALVSLGYDRKAAKSAVAKIDHIEELDVNSILKMSLQYLY